MDKNRRGIDWSDYLKMREPYGRWPFAVIDEEGKLWTRTKVKGAFEHFYYDNRATGGGYHSVSTHIYHVKLRFGKFIWTKKELQQLNK
jgi:hypothetical protein